MEPVEDEDLTGFDYANRTGRPSGRVLTVASRLLPGVAAVQNQVAPYARSWRAANLAALARPGRRWIVFGDSMSQGIGASGFDRGWVDQVRLRLGADASALRIVNLSASGARADDVLAQQLPAWSALPPRPADPDDPGPDLITVLIGSNDLMSRDHRDHLAATLRRVLDRLPPGSVVATLPQPRRPALEANAEIAAAVRDRGLIAVDMRERGPRSWRGKLAADHFHPNDEGYRAVAEAFLPAIREAFGRG